MSMELRWLINKYGSSAKRGVDFRSDWALCRWRYAFAQIKHCCWRYVSTTLSHRAKLPGGVRWAFVPLLLIPNESLSLHSNQPLHIPCIFWHATLVKVKLQQLYESEATANVNHFTVTSYFVWLWWVVIVFIFGMDKKFYYIVDFRLFKASQHSQALAKFIF